MSSILFQRALGWAAKIAMIALAASDVAVASPGSDALFARGEFDRAKVAYAADLVAQPNDPGALLGLARIELYENHLDASAEYVARLLALNPNDDAAKRLMQTIEERRAILASAASLAVPDGGVALPFLESEPLPAIQLLVNGKPGSFVLDTGGSDVTLDPDFAKECGVTMGGGHVGTFLGGNAAEVREGMAERIDAGSLSLSNVSVTILPARGFHLYPNRTVDGVVGTVFLSRFLSTIDYPGHRLLLQPRSLARNIGANQTAIPMWLVGDHFIFAMGSVNGLERQLFNVDSGGAGVGFMPVAATIAAAHIKTLDDRAFQGMGGGGAATVVPIVAGQVCLGSACQSDVNGGYTPAGSPLSRFPFAAAGAVSHAFLEKYAVTFDFVRMQIVLSPRS